jgi:hypothetical protein
MSVFFKTYRAASGAGTFDQIVEALRALASDPDSDPAEAEKAKAALSAMADDKGSSAAKRNAACNALKRVEATIELRSRMGLKANRPGVVHSGHRSTFNVLTAEDAKRHIASKKR